VPRSGTDRSFGLRLAAHAVLAFLVLVGDTLD
jgi:hypothetical protein